jgi:RNA polymerase sigma factor (sigma-70 family)
MARVREAPAGVRQESEVERVYREKGRRMWHAALAFAGDPEVANDAVAEAFAQALRRGSEIRDVERWLWRAIFRIAAGELQERGRHVEGPIESPYEMEEPARELVAALGKLPERQRVAVVMHHVGGYPVREIGAILRSSSAAVRMQLTRGRRRLRELLLEERDD